MIELAACKACVFERAFDVFLVAADRRMLGPLVFSHPEFGVFLYGVCVMHKETAERAADNGGHAGK